MIWLATAFTLLTPAPDDKEAQVLFEKMKRKIMEARSLRVDYGIESRAGVGRGSVRIKGRDRWACRFRYVSGMLAGKWPRTDIVSDGRRTVNRGSHAGLPAETMKSEEIILELKRLVSSLIEKEIFLPMDQVYQSTATMVAGSVRDGGAARVDGRDARVIRFSQTTVGSGRKPVRGETRLFIDPSTFLPIKKEITVGSTVMILSFTTFVVDGDVPDSEFALTSALHLARARAGQVARSAELFATITGRPPRSLGELTTRPADLDAAIFWPRGGFVLGGKPTGAFGLRKVKGLLSVSGRIGDEEIAVEIAPASMGPVGAPTERVRKHYDARVELHLMAAAVRAYRETYGSLPRRKADLWERPDGEEVWPEGGWLPGGKVPVDPWGDPYRIVTDRSLVRVQAQNLSARGLTLSKLTPEERKGLEAAARPRATPGQRETLGRLIDRLADDDLETREEAGRELPAWEAVIVPLLNERLKVEKDSYRRRWLAAVSRSIRTKAPAWKTELGRLAAIVVRSPGSRMQFASNERNASASLKTLATAEADFRANDRDGNKISDYWTGDVAGLYCMTNAAVKGNKDDPMKLIELSIAAADAAPLEAGAAGGEYGELPKRVTRAPKAGYFFRALKADRSAGEEYARDTGGSPRMGKVHNNSRFGFCAYPAEYGVTGRMTFFINEANTMFKKDTQGEPVLEWPTDEVLRAEWGKMD